jgi:hypothetical protein
MVSGMLHFYVIFVIREVRRLSPRRLPGGGVKGLDGTSLGGKVLTAFSRDAFLKPIHDRSHHAGSRSRG